MISETSLMTAREVLVHSNLATDLDASIRFVNAAVDTLRYCPGIGWLRWDGRRWAENAEWAAVEFAKKMARAWLKKTVRSGDRSKVTEAAYMEMAPRIHAVVKLAESDACMRIEANQLDRDQLLMNIEDGTLDLRTGTLRPHSKDDLITKLAPVRWIEGAAHPMLDRYLDHLTQSSPEVVPFLARCFGTALTGDASPESLFLLQGDGASGKTTLVEAVAAMLGPYAVKLRFESFCQSKHGRSPGGATPDLMALRGSRLAYASEGDQSAKLNAGLVKELTGKEPVSARGLYQKQLVAFPQTWKLWLVSNFEPRADSDDTGIWRRVLKIFFAVVPEDRRDPRIKEALATDPLARAALLQWCVKGCMDWQSRGGGRVGLAAPESVLLLTNEYREKQDLLGEWWKALMVEAEMSTHDVTAGRVLRDHYEDWAKDQGALPVQAKRFREYLKSKGLTEYRTNEIRGWRGLKFEYIEPCLFQKRVVIPRGLPPSVNSPKWQRPVE
jgi:putative DNA primase/helicase